MRWIEKCHPEPCDSFPVGFSGRRRLADSLQRGLVRYDANTGILRHDSAAPSDWLHFAGEYGDFLLSHPQVAWRESGVIGLQNSHAAAPGHVEFRNIRNIRIVRLSP